MAFCSYNILLKIAASFSMVALVYSPVPVCSWRFSKKDLTGHGLTCEVLSYFPEGSFHSRLELGTCSWTFSKPTRERCRGYTRSFAFRNFLFAEKSSFTSPCWTLLSFCWKKKKEQLIQKLLTHLIRTKYNKIRNSKSSRWIGFIE